MARFPGNRNGGNNNNYDNNRSANYGSNGRSTNPDDYPKHSGCKVVTWTKDGKLHEGFSAWMLVKGQGIFSFLAATYKGSSEHVSKSGRTWTNGICKVSPPMGKSFLVSCLFDHASEKCRIPELNLVLNCKARRGGYCGKPKKV